MPKLIFAVMYVSLKGKPYTLF